jgi:hypothetical protein
MGPQLEAWQHRDCDAVLMRITVFINGERHSSVCGKTVIAGEMWLLVCSINEKMKTRGSVYCSYRERQTVDLCKSLKFRFRALKDDGVLVRDTFMCGRAGGGGGGDRV